MRTGSTTKGSVNMVIVIPVAIDVEPGGSTRNIARVGVADVEPGGLCFQVRFQSP